MTEPIKNKFELIDGHAADRHAQLLDSLGDLLTALETLPALATAVADLATAQALTNTKLQALTDSLTGEAGILPPLALTQTNANNHLATMEPDIEQVRGNLAALRTTIGDLPVAGVNSLYDWTQLGASRAGLLVEATGAPSTVGGRTVLDLLACLCDTALAALPIDPTDPTKSPAGCSTPFTSDGTIIIPASAVSLGTNIAVATFSTPPEGTTFGTVFGLVYDHTSLIFPSDVAWFAFVKSDQPQYSDEATSFNRYPTNQWRQLTPGEHGFSVSANGGLEVYLCSVTTNTLPQGCTVFEDIRVVGSRNTLTNQTGNFRTVVWPYDWARSTDAGLTENGETEGDNEIPNGDKVWLPGDYRNWTITLTGGGGTVYVGPNSNNSYYTLTNGTPFTMPDVERFYLAFVLDNNVTKVELCSPAL